MKSQRATAAALFTASIALILAIVAIVLVLLR